MINASRHGRLAMRDLIGLPSASNLWVQSSLAQKQRLQQVFFPDGIRFDGKACWNRHDPAGFNYLNPTSEAEEGLVDQTGASWNQIVLWLSRLEDVRVASR